MRWFVIYAIVAFVGLVWRWWTDDEHRSWETVGDVTSIAFWPITAVCIVVVFLASLANDWRDGVRERQRIRKAAGAAPQGDQK